MNLIEGFIIAIVAILIIIIFILILNFIKTKRNSQRPYPPPKNIKFKKSSLRKEAITQQTNEISIQKIPEHYTSLSKSKTPEKTKRDDPRPCPPPKNINVEKSLPSEEETIQQSNEISIQKLPEHYTSSSIRKTPSVFISYVSVDRQIADSICDKLEENNINCWIAPRDVLPGEDFPKSIINAINESKVMVLIFSASANRSPHVTREVTKAVGKGIIIIPFRIEDAPMSESMEYLIGIPHWLDALTPPLEQHIFKLINIIKELTKDRDIENPQKDQKTILDQDIIECTVFSPQKIALETSILVQVFAHTFTDEATVKTTAKEFDQDTERRGFTTLTTQVMRKSQLSFHLEMDGLDVGSPVQTLVWYGRPASVNFKVTAQNHPLSGIILAP